MHWRERANRMRALSLAEVLRRSGATPDPADPHKWRTPQGPVSVTGAKFINWQTGHGGGGAIDLVMSLHQLPFGPALQWLESRFGGASTAAPLPSSELEAPGSDLLLPPPVPRNLPRIRQYLGIVRGLPGRVIEPLIQTGQIYADGRGNAVFLLRDETNQAVGAELRGTHPGTVWRGMTPGSRKDLGYFEVTQHPIQAIVLCESAIDALSLHVLHPEYRCLSTAGARAHPAWLPACLAGTCPVYCGFDSDETGDAMAKTMLTLHPSILRLRPSCKDWNDVLRLGL